MGCKSEFVDFEATGANIDTEYIVFPELPDYDLVCVCTIVYIYIYIYIVYMYNHNIYH